MFKKRFVKYLCFINRVDYVSSQYEQLCVQFRLTTLVERRRVTDLVLFHKILHSKVNCPYLLSTICLYVPERRTRHTSVFTCRKKCRLIIRKNDFMPRTTSLVNSLSRLDFFDCCLTKCSISTSVLH